MNLTSLKKDFAESFSLSFHPLFIPFYTLMFIFVLPIFQVQTLGRAMQLSILIIVSLSTIILPLGSLFYLKKKKVISSIKIPNRSERTTPYVYTIIYFAAAAFMLYRIDFIPLLIPIVLIIPAVVISLLLIFNFWIKISAHAAGMGSLNAIIYVLMHVYYLDLAIAFNISLLLAFIIIISRKYLKSHSYLELILGYSVGGIVSLIISFWAL